MMITLPRLVAMVVAGVGLVIPALYFIPYPDLTVLIESIALVMGLMIAISYGTGLRALGVKDTAGYLLVLGIVMVWGSLSLRVGWTWMYRFNGEPGWMLESWVYPITAWVFVVGGTFHLTARNAIEGRIPRVSWLWLPTAVVLGFILTGVVVSDFFEHIFGE